jgi:hypothetical protein
MRMSVFLSLPVGHLRLTYSDVICPWQALNPW